MIWNQIVRLNHHPDFTSQTQLHLSNAWMYVLSDSFWHSFNAKAASPWRHIALRSCDLVQVIQRANNNAEYRCPSFHRQALHLQPTLTCHRSWICICWSATDNVLFRTPCHTQAHDCTSVSGRTLGNQTNSWQCIIFEPKMDTYVYKYNINVYILTCRFSIHRLEPSPKKI